MQNYSISRVGYVIYPIININTDAIDCLWIVYEAGFSADIGGES